MSVSSILLLCMYVYVFVCRAEEVKWIANQNKIYQITIHRGQHATAEIVTHSLRSDHSVVHEIKLPDLPDDP